MFTPQLICTIVFAKIGFSHDVDHKEHLNFAVEAIPSGLILGSFVNIRKTCPWNLYPLILHFYIAQLAYAGVCLVFLFLL